MSCTQENELILYVGNAGDKVELNYTINTLYYPTDAQIHGLII